jgi:hypothetical protein
VAMQAMTSYTADRFYELSIRFRPLVEVHIIRSDRHPWVSRIIDTVWYANWAHFICGFGVVMWINFGLTIYSYRLQGLAWTKQIFREAERERERERVEFC